MTRAACYINRRYQKTDKSCSKRDGNCIENDGFCIENGEFRIINAGKANESNRSTLGARFSIDFRLISG